MVPAAALLPLLVLVAPALAKNNKRGLAYSDKTPLDDIKAATVDNGAASWVYTWQTLPADQIKNSGLEFVPMQHDRNGLADLSANLNGLGAKIVLGFNEPERGDQANIPVAEAVQYYKDNFVSLHDSGVRVGAPAVSAAPEGQQWIKDFVSQCGDGCGIDFVPLHWYGDGAQYFLDYVKEFHGWVNKPLWVTEFASTSTDAGVVSDFLTTTVNALDGGDFDFVERYAWFAYGRVPNDGQFMDLLDANGAANDLGKIYLFE